MTEQERWEEISNYSQSYYEGHPEISDAEFDELYEKFKKDFPNSNYLKLPAKGFDPNATNLQKFKHKYSTVGSISKIHSVEETNFVAPFFYNISVKLDGSSLVLYYVDGQLERALTRGDGLYGLDVTNKVKYLCPEALTPKFFHEKPFTGAVRGEVVMSNCAFQEYKKEHPEAKMARNVSTGLMMRKDVSEELKYCDYIAYKILAVENDAMLEWWLPEVHLQLKNWGFKVVTSVTVEGETITDDFMSQLKQREDFNTYPTDGLVIETCSLTSDEAGIVTYVEVAYKFAAETKTCKVIDVKWNFSPKGKLVPVVQIEPTMMSGALVSNVSGFNYKFIMDNNIGPGAEITVCRSGEVIPDIQSVTKPSVEVASPYTCPECGELLELTKTGVDLVCSNPDCKGRKFYNRYTFIEKMAEDIKGFGEVLIQQLVDAMTECSLALEAYTEASLFFDIQHAENSFFQNVFTPANAEKCVKLKQLFQKPLSKEKFLRAMNIDLLGEVAAKQISSNPQLFNTLFSCDKAQLPAQLSALGVAPVLASNIIKNIQRIRNFNAINITWEEDKSENINKFIAVTGSLSIPRKEFEAKLNAKGYGITDNMKKAEFLVTNDPNSGSSKNKKAKELGLYILTEEEFWRRV
jgi:DNA ligase (NAD+)